MLDTDGVGRSHTRTNLRRFFEVDRYCIAHAAIARLPKDGKMTGKDVAPSGQTVQDRCGQGEFGRGEI
nr:hypothetical protein [Pseudoxanthomonas winnipegensis]